jgi:alpha-D-ribose 1-methylphosphonate 5-triphosphate synthase subunit PhnH
MTSSTIELGGFADPVADAQAIFRAVLDAMAHPGRICPAGFGFHPPAPLDQSTAAVALTLIDQETPLYLDADARSAGPWLAFHVGASIIANQERAAFVLTLSCPDLAALATGSDEAPETSTTLILQVAALGRGTTYRISGPGLAEPSILRATGLPDDFVGSWRRNHALFPRGVDMVLCAGDQLTALPRSVTLEAA